MKIRDAILRLAILGSILLSGICFSQAKSYQFEAIENLQKSEKKRCYSFHPHQLVQLLQSDGKYYV